MFLLEEQFQFCMIVLNIQLLHQSQSKVGYGCLFGIWVESVETELFCTLVHSCELDHVILLFIKLFQSYRCTIKIYIYIYIWADGFSGVPRISPSQDRTDMRDTRKTIGPFYNCENLRRNIYIYVCILDKVFGRN